MVGEKVIGVGCSKREGEYIITLYKDANEMRPILKVRKKDRTTKNQNKKQP